MRKSETLIFFIVIISFLAGIYLYPSVPQEMASHWNINGEVDGYMAKFWGLFLMPVISAILFLLFLMIPRIDPMSANIAKFREYFDEFVLVMFLFLFYLYFLTIVWNLGVAFSMIRFLVPALGIVFYYAGVLIENAKRNWFIGIRTPWTMMSDNVWDKTHRIGGRLFKACGIISLYGVFVSSIAFFLVIIPVILVAIYLVAYSYFEYQKEVKSSKNPAQNL